MTMPTPGKAGFAEDQLLVQAREGSAEAFCALIDPLQARLLQQALALSPEGGGEDLVQQTLVEAWRSLARFDGSCRLSTWLYAILLHRYQKALRAAAARPVSLARLAPDDARKRQGILRNLASGEPGPDVAAQRAERVRRIREHVLALPPEQGHVVLLRFFEGASLAEIAAAMGTSLGTVKSRLHHALEKLRRMNLRQFRGDR